MREHDANANHALIPHPQARLAEVPATDQSNIYLQGNVNTIGQDQHDGSASPILNKPLRL